MRNRSLIGSEEETTPTIEDRSSTASHRLSRAVARTAVSFSVRHPGWVLGTAMALAGLALLSAFARLEIKTSNLDLMDPDQPEVVRFLDFAHRFGTPNAAVLVLEAEDPTVLPSAVRRLGSMLRRLRGVRLVADRLDVRPEILELNGLDEYFTSYDHSQYYIFVQPQDERSDLASITPLLAEIRATISRSELAVTGVHVGITGIPQYALDDQDLIRRDIGRISVLSMVGVVGVLAIGLGGLRWPLVLAVGLAISLAWTAGVASWIPGHLTLLSAFFASILFGLGIDFSIHAMARLSEEPSGRPLTERLVVSMTDIAPAVITATVTTAAVFFVLMLSGFRGFAELGWIAGVGMLLCVASGFTVLPALIVSLASDQAAPGSGLRVVGGARGFTRAGWRFVSGRFGRMIGVVLLAAAILLPIAGAPGFDSDYSHLQPRNSETVRLERGMVEKSDLSPQFAAFEVDSESAARRLSERLLDEPLVGDVRSAADFTALIDERGNQLRLPASLAAAFISPAGRYAVYAYPARDAWDSEASRDFVERMQRLDPEVTGMPILGKFMLDQTHRALRRTLWIGGLALMCSLLVTFRRLRPALVAAVPTALTLLSLGGVMAVLGLSWNPLSIMALPVVLGIAVDDGVHIVHRFSSLRDVTETLRTTGRSVALTSLTTIAGFAGLSSSSHRGLSSFAVVLVLGVALALLHSLFVLPLLLRTDVLGQRLLAGGEG